MADISRQPITAQLRLSTRRPAILIPGLTQAIAGIARAGVTYSNDTTASIGTFPEYLDIVLNGDVVTNHVELDELTIELGIGLEVSTATLRLASRGCCEPERGHEIQMWVGGIGTGVPLFGGTVLYVDQRIRRTVDDVVYTLRAVDYRWIADRYLPVLVQHGNMGINRAVSEILSDSTDPASNVRKGYVDASLGDIGVINFSGDSVTRAMQRLAENATMAAYWTITPGPGETHKTMSVFSTPWLAANSHTVEDGGTWRNLRITEDLSQTKNRVYLVGGGSVCTSRVGPGSTTIPVEETGWYNPNGGTVRVLADDITYTGLSTLSNTGNLTGVTGVSYDIAEGANVWNLSQADDTDAQTDLATRLGGGQSGVASATVVDHRLGYQETANRAQAILADLATPNITIDYDIVPENDAASPFTLMPGNTVTVGITTPVELAGTFRVRSVTLEPHARRTTDGTLTFMRHVRAQLVTQEFDSAVSLFDAMFSETT